MHPTQCVLIISSILGVGRPWSAAGQTALPDEVGATVGGATDAAREPADETSELPRRHAREFAPSLHGFAFGNSFPGIPPLPKVLRDERTTVGAIAKVIAQAAGGSPDNAGFGLCGGMSAAAADCFLAGADRPTITTAPDRGSPLFEYLVRRQTDSLGVAAFMAVRFAEWMTLPDAADEWGGVEGRTALELPSIIERLEAGHLVPLGLVYRRVGEGALWDNHQVLAYACVRENARTVRVRIYDPNWPGDDAAELKVTLSAALDAHPTAAPTTAPTAAPTPTPMATQPSPGRVNRATTRQLGSRSRERTVRGFFPMPYTPEREIPALGTVTDENAAAQPIGADGIP